MSLLVATIIRSQVRSISLVALIYASVLCQPVDAQTLRAIIDGPLSDEALELLSELSISPQQILRESQRNSGISPAGAGSVAPSLELANDQQFIDILELPSETLNGAEFVDRATGATGTVLGLNFSEKGVPDRLMVQMSTPFAVDGFPIAVAPETVSVLQDSTAIGPASVEFVTDSSDWTASIYDIMETARQDSVSGESFNLETGPSLLEKVSSDVAISGASDRLFSPPPELPPNRRQEIVSALRAMNVQITEVGSDGAIPAGLFEPIYATEENDGTLPCPDPRAAWPPNGIVEIAQFGVRLRETVGLEQVRRSKVLVVDTGLGRGLAEGVEFAPMLYREASELLTQPVTIERGRANFTDRDGSGYYFDEYSAAIENRTQSRSGAVPQPSEAVRQKTATVRETYAKDKLPEDESDYDPDHGSFVAALAGGGPGLIGPEIAPFVGIQAFRLTTRSDAPPQSVFYEGTELELALQYAMKRHPDIVNMSLRSQNRAAFLANDQPNWGDALLVVAAGNLAGPLNGQAVDEYPAALAAGGAGTMPGLIVVAAYDGYTGGLWANSREGPDVIDIAAPGVNIRSSDRAGQDSCKSGTSASAPLVSFTLGLVGSLSGLKGTALANRVFASAQRHPALIGRVRLGRLLDTVAAADVFVDRVYLGDNFHRGWILPHTDDLPNQTMNLCMLNGDPWQLDLGFLGSLFVDGDETHVWRYPNAGPISVLDITCDRMTSGSFVFFDLEARTTGPILWDQVTRIVATPFRGNIPELMELARSGQLTP